MKNIRLFLTHFSLEAQKKVTGKQCRPTSDYIRLYTVCIKRTMYASAYEDHLRQLMYTKDHTYTHLPHVEMYTWYRNVSEGPPVAMYTRYHT